MIVVQIHDGLGNQMFIYAAARALGQKNRTSLYLDVDADCRDSADGCASGSYSFQLNRFNISASMSA